MTKHSSLASVKATRTRLDELGLYTKKTYGQHFLVDDGVVGKIIRLASLSPGSPVVEVGPGIGTLTEALLASGVALSSVEVDESLWAGLKDSFPDLSLIEGDALDPAVIARLQEIAPHALVANLPYAVAATIILEYFQQLPSLKSATIMVQKEVAERIAAQPGTKAYGSYTIKLQLLTHVAGQFKVGAQSFFPPPRVESAVIRLERHALYSSNEASFASTLTTASSSCTQQNSNNEDLPLLALASTLADAAFFQRRKTLSNSLKAYFSAHTEQEILPAQEVESLLARAELAPNIRGETLTPDDFVSLAKALVCITGSDRLRKDA